MITASSQTPIRSTAKKTVNKKLPKIKMVFKERRLSKGLGEAVAKRTILRTKKDGSLETWGEVADRVARGNTLLIPEKDKAHRQTEYQLLKKHIANASLLMSGRHLQHGDETQPKRNMEVFTNCFHKNQEFLTLEYGPVTFAKAFGKKVTVRGKDGKWHQAVVKKFGRQKLFTITFGPVNNARTNYPLEVIATQDHRWILQNGAVTTSLKKDDIVKAAPAHQTLDQEAIRHGLVFGDGTAHKSRNDYNGRIVSQGRQYCSLRLCGESKKFLKHFKNAYSITYPEHAQGDPVVYIGKENWKDLPHCTDPDYIAGFIYGWWLADGSKTYPTKKGIEIATSNISAVKWLKTFAPYAGYIITGYSKKNRKIGDGSFKNGLALYSIRLAHNKNRKVLSVKSYGEEIVYCVEEKKTHSFVLANGLLTGNCSTASSSFLLFYLLLNGSGVGRAYDDDLMLVDWDYMPIIRCVLDEKHADFVWGEDESVSEARKKYQKAHWFIIPDDREGWAQAVEKIEVMAFEKKYKDDLLIIDFSKIRPKGSVIRGMQNRPASGPRPLIKAIQKVATVKNAGMPQWKQTLFVDHYLSECVLVGGARRAARIATKAWTDAEIFDFISIKKGGFLWSANNSVTVDDKFWKQKTKHSKKVLEAILKASYYDLTGEPGFINQHKLVQNDAGYNGYLDGKFAKSKKYQPMKRTIPLMAKIAKHASSRYYTQIPNPCGEISLNMLGGYCVIADLVPYFAPDLDTAEEAFRAAVRALIRVNQMDCLYKREVRRTNRIGISMTGIHEFAWNMFGYGFRDLIDETKSQNFWDVIARFKRAVVEEAKIYSKKLGVNTPHTNTTIKPSGTISKLFSLSEGAHLPPMREYLRWVQFRFDDPLVKRYHKLGYPVKELKSYPGTTVVGFPTQPEICKLGMNGKLVTAAEATPEEQFKWLMLLEKYWLVGVDINGKPFETDTGNQVSYTLKYNPQKVSFAKFSAMIKKYQPLVKTCSVMPKVDTTAYEYQPEEAVTIGQFMNVIREISDSDGLLEDIDLEHLKCASGACPI